jgi:hypothetical protein
MEHLKNFFSKKSEMTVKELKDTLYEYGKLQYFLKRMSLLWRKIVVAELFNQIFHIIDIVPEYGHYFADFFKGMGVAAPGYFYTVPMFSKPSLT